MSGDGMTTLGEAEVSPVTGRNHAQRTFATVAAASRALGVTMRAIRFYEERGLIQCARGPLGHRILDAATQHRLNQIVELRRLGLSLGEISALLDAKTARSELLRARLEVLLARLDDQRRAVSDHLASLAAL
jgi:DNA-binding transcriptional MerR regulator